MCKRNMAGAQWLDVCSERICSSLRPLRNNTFFLCVCTAWWTACQLAQVSKVDNTAPGSAKFQRCQVLPGTSESNKVFGHAVVPGSRPIVWRLD